MASEWDFVSSSEIIFSLGDFNGHMGKDAEGFEGAHRENGTGKEMQEEEDFWNSVTKKAVRGKHIVI